MTSHFNLDGGRDQHTPMAKPFDAVGGRQVAGPTHRILELLSVLIGSIGFNEPVCIQS